MSHELSRDFSTIPYIATEITRFINQNSVPFIHRSVDGPTLLSPPGTPCPRKSQIQASRIADYSISAAAKPGLLSIIIHCMQPQGRRPFLFQICLQWDSNPGALLLRSAAVLTHNHTNKNETGPCVQLSKGQKGCKAHVTENPQVSYRQKMQLIPQISSDNG